MYYVVGMSPLADFERQKMLPVSCILGIPTS